ncbi:cystathionine gamma-synthase [Haliangium ochraceum]|uniref:Cystathionine gamma-lyase n=1 Tax=Haliangium ochraceum (strain DSM 14365 / JCM 11303 / SMP-2) TaxID=502025 RepID=D0LT35_HALO1|nr:cystathionine gamma-synthase [Haliangium ochraceum]ACY19171.1 Cystathionine gamma-lyase [Haliangium ochraceum DSM 14365]
MGSRPPSHGFGTRAIHAGQSPDPSTGAIMTPVYMTSTYVQSTPGEHKGFEYSRTQNPTRSALEANLAALEGARHGLAFASGLAATSTALQLLSAGDHVVACDDLYGGTYRLFDKVYRRFGLSFDYVDPSAGPSAVEAALTDATRMVWLETPTNPMLKLCDIAAVAELCKRRGLLLAVDNTFLTPFNQNPLALGADLVCHSTTKYLNGHSDTVGGALITDNDELHEKLAFLQNAVGAVPSPMDSFLVMRGLKTLHVRMERHERNARALAEWLVGHEQVERVIYPGLESHPQHELAKRQQRGFGGMISFDLRGGEPAARRFLETCELFSLAESLGGVESLVEHPAIMTHASVPAERRRALGIGDGFIRLSVGIEELDDLRGDLERAFFAARS